MSIGRLIQEVFEETEMKVAVLARRIGMSRQSVYNIFEKETLETELLMKISQVLGYDFFRHFRFERGTGKMIFVYNPNPDHYRPDIRLKQALWGQAQAESRIEQLEKRLADKEKLIELLRSGADESSDEF